MSILQKVKYKIHLKNDYKRRLRIINNYAINILFDIGANTGQYAKKMRNLGYNEKIVSFEPLNDVVENLKQTALHDKNWVVNNYALGNKDSNGVINVSRKSDCSSILNMLPVHKESASGLEYINQQQIEIKKLDTVFDTFAGKSDKVMIKIDTQGYEKNVIDGAIESLNKILIIQLEMSIVPMYENEMLFIEMIGYLKNKGFQLYSLENGHFNRNTGQLLQVDGIFCK
jgi:FkbM family methyltransferase